MQQGMLSSLLLSMSLVFGSSGAYATEMKPVTAQQWLQDEQINTKVSELLLLVMQDEVETLRFSLQRLALPQQEVARYLLLQKIEHQNISLTPRMAIFIESQSQLVPTYQILERGDGYEFTVPAFNFPVIANRLLQHWKKDQNILAFVIKAEQKELVLQEWLSGSEHQIKAREALLIRELDGLSAEAVDALATQLTQGLVISWLPSTSVVVRLAQVSRDADVYKMLWRMKADSDSQYELQRLANDGDSFSVEQLMNATQNPSLKRQAIEKLTQLHPLPENVKVFLISRMGLAEEASMVAQELVNQGHQSWLHELVSSNRQVKVTSIQKVLSN